MKLDYQPNGQINKLFTIYAYIYINTPEKLNLLHITTVIIVLLTQVSFKPPSNLHLNEEIGSDFIRPKRIIEHHIEGTFLKIFKQT